MTLNLEYCRPEKRNKAQSGKSFMRAKIGGHKVTAPSLPVDLHEHRKPEDERRDLDFYPTAGTGGREAVRALLSRESDILKKLGKVIWEPAVGAGDIVNVATEHGFDAIGSDIVDRAWPGTIVKNFYDYTDAPAPIIITNPPYDQINARDGWGRWLRHQMSMKSWRYCAMLLSWDWPAAKTNGFGALIRQNPFSYCYLLQWKLDFTGERSPPQRNAWFVWNRDDPREFDSEREPGFRLLGREDDRQDVLKV